MRVHVISLEGSIERRMALEARLGALGVDYAICPAIEGCAGYAAFDSCDFERYRLNTGRAPSDGEVGCYGSHLLLWRLCAATDEALAVMEDDAEPLPTFPAAIKAARRVIDRYGFVRFQHDGPTRPARTCVVEATDGFEVHFFLKYPFGSMCYALSPAVALAFVSASRELRSPVDQFIKRCWEHRQPLYGLLPYSVLGSAHTANSTIPVRGGQKPSAGLRARRLLHKVDAGIQRALFNQRWSRRSASARPQ